MNTILRVSLSCIHFFIEPICNELLSHNLSKTLPIKMWWSMSCEDNNARRNGLLSTLICSDIQMIVYTSLFLQQKYARKVIKVVVHWSTKAYVLKSYMGSSDYNNKKRKNLRKIIHKPHDEYKEQGSMDIVHVNITKNHNENTQSVISIF